MSSVIQMTFRRQAAGIRDCFACKKSREVDSRTGNTPFRCARFSVLLRFVSSADEYKLPQSSQVSAEQTAVNLVGLKQTQLCRNNSNVMRSTPGGMSVIQIPYVALT
jgi:hypothetical protein